MHVEKKEASGKVTGDGTDESPVVSEREFVGFFFPTEKRDGPSVGRAGPPGALPPVVTPGRAPRTRSHGAGSRSGGWRTPTPARPRADPLGSPHTKEEREGERRQPLP